MFYNPAKFKQVSTFARDNKINCVSTEHEGYLPIWDTQTSNKTILEKFRDANVIVFFRWFLNSNLNKIINLKYNYKVFFYQLDKTTKEPLKPTNMRPYAVLKYNLKNPYVINRNIYRAQTH